jgi:hypothetical protein
METGAGEKQASAVMLFGVGSRRGVDLFEHGRIEMSLFD